MKRPRYIAAVGFLLALASCQSTPDPQPSSDQKTHRRNASEAPPQDISYPDVGPPLAECPEYKAAKGEICRLTPVDGHHVRLRVRFSDTIAVESSAPIPPDLIRYRFLGRLEDFAACLIPAARDEWTGEADTAIKATLTGATFDHITMAPAGLPESTTACFRELTRRLRIKREPGEDARVTQPVVVQIER